MKKISRKHESTKARNFNMRYTHHDSSGIKLYYETKDDRHQFERLSRKIIGAAIAVHKELGPGYLEHIYEEALKLEFGRCLLCFESQKEIHIKYHGIEIGTHRLDLVVEGKIVVELKAVKEFSDIHYAQLRSYLKATGLKVGLLLNFAKPTLHIKRVVN